MWFWNVRGAIHEHESVAYVLTVIARRGSPDFGTRVVNGKFHRVVVKTLPSLRVVNRSAVALMKWMVGLTHNVDLPETEPVRTFPDAQIVRAKHTAIGRHTYRNQKPSQTKFPVRYRAAEGMELLGVVRPEMGIKDKIIRAAPTSLGPCRMMCDLSVILEKRNHFLARLVQGEARGEEPRCEVYSVLLDVEGLHPSDVQ
jgi:hypothetical protein